MTREEEITQAAKEIARKWYHDPNNETAYIAARQGMLWSDEHPKPNLVDINKVVEWLKENVTYTDNGDEKCLINLGFFIDAMMEE